MSGKIKEFKKGEIDDGPLDRWLDKAMTSVEKAWLVRPNDDEPMAAMVIDDMGSMKVMPLGECMEGLRETGLNEPADLIESKRTPEGHFWLVVLVDSRLAFRVVDARKYRAEHPPKNLN